MAAIISGTPSKGPIQSRRDTCSSPLSLYLLAVPHLDLHCEPIGQVHAVEQQPPAWIGQVLVDRPTGAVGVTVVVDDQDSTRHELRVEVIELGLGAAVGVRVEA